MALGLAVQAMDQLKTEIDKGLEYIAGKWAKFRRGTAAARCTACGWFQGRKPGELLPRKRGGSPVITDGSLIDSGVAVATMWRKSKNGVPLKSNGSSSQKIAMLGFHFLDYAMTRCGGFWCTFQVPQESWVDLRPGKSRGPRVGSRSMYQECSGFNNPRTILRLMV